MKRLETRLEGPILIEPTVHGDARGFFLETFRAGALAELGVHDDWVQDNHSRSAHGVLRGMHFQPGMAKLVRCARGAILDVLVDIRPRLGLVRELGGIRAGRPEPPPALRAGRLRTRLLRAHGDRRRGLQVLHLLRPGSRVRLLLRRPAGGDRVARRDSSSRPPSATAVRRSSPSSASDEPPDEPALVRVQHEPVERAPIGDDSDDGGQQHGHQRLRLEPHPYGDEHAASTSPSE